METSSVPSVGKIDSDVTASTMARVYEPAVEAEGRVKSVQAAPAAAQPKVEARVEPASRNNVQLRFQVDPESQDLTILVLDRASQEVIRTIPSSELYKMNEGDLISLFA